jgi:hypothetical protein
MQNLETRRIPVFLRYGLFAFSICILIIGLAFGIRKVMGETTVGIDYFVYWNAGKALVNHQNPYSPQVAIQIQEGIYQRPARENEDPMLFSNPLYALAAVLPVISFRFEWAQAFWLALNIVAFLVILIMSLPHAPKWLILSLPFTYNFAFGLIVGNFSVMISALLILGCSYFLYNQPETTFGQAALGALLAWCTIKPQFVWAYLIFFFLQSFKLRRKIFLISFIVSLGLFIAVSFWVMPQWLGSWLEQIGSYSGHPFYSRTITSIAGLVFPQNYLAVGETIILSLVGLIVLWQLFLWWKSNKRASSLPAWLSLITYFFLPNNTSAEQAILLVPVILSLGRQNQRSLTSKFFWLVWFVGSYLAFSLTFTGIYPDGVKLLMFALYCLWFVYNEYYLHKILTAYQPG